MAGRRREPIHHRLRQARMGQKLPPGRHVTPPWAQPFLSLDLTRAGVATVIRATGSRLDFGWRQVDSCHAARQSGQPVRGRPRA